MKPKYKICEI